MAEPSSCNEFNGFNYVLESLEENSKVKCFHGFELSKGIFFKNNLCSVLNMSYFLVPFNTILFVWYLAAST